MAVTCRGTADRELETLAAGGIRGIRLSIMLKGAIGTDQLERMANRVRDFGWHIVIHVDKAQVIAELAPRLRRDQAGILTRAGLFLPLALAFNFLSPSRAAA